MHLIEVCLPSPAASFLGYGEEKAFFIEGGKPLLPIKGNPKPVNVKPFLAVCIDCSSNVPKVYPRGMQKMLSGSPVVH